MIARRLSLAIGAVVSALALILAPVAANASSGWTTPVTLTDSGLNATGDGVALAVGPHDEIGAAWTHFVNGGYEIQTALSRDAGRTWSTPVTVSEIGNHAEGPQIAINNSGAIMVSWSEETNFWRVRYSKSTDGGLTWSPYNTVSNDVDSSSGTSLVAVGDHGFVIGMDVYNGLFSDVFVRSTPDDGSSWSGFSRLSNGTENSFGVDTAADSAGNVAAVWLTNKSGQMEIQASASHDDGLNWGGSTEINPGLEAGFYPSIAASATDGFITVWESIDGSSVHGLMSSTGHDAGAAWSSPVAVGDDVGGTPEYAMATGPGGVAAVVWTKVDGLTSTAYSAFSTDNGATWSTPAVIATDDSGIGFPFYNLKVVITTEGKMVADWTKIVDRSGENDLVQASTSIDHGATWASMVDVSGPGGGYSNLAATGHGDVVAAWPQLVNRDTLDVPVQASTLLVPALPDTGADDEAHLTGLGLVGSGLALVGVLIVLFRRKAARRSPA